MNISRTANFESKNTQLNLFDESESSSNEIFEETLKIKEYPLITNSPFSHFNINKDKDKDNQIQFTSLSQYNIETLNSFTNRTHFERIKEISGNFNQIKKMQKSERLNKIDKIDKIEHLLEMIQKEKNKGIKAMDSFENMKKIERISSNTRTTTSDSIHWKQKLLII